jgi:cyclohexyl-isocyanide hydratase
MITPDTHLQIGSLLFEGLDQIDLTGPFEVLSRIPSSTYRLYGKIVEAVRDVSGLRLMPDAALADAPHWSSAIRLLRPSPLNDRIRA